MFQEWNNKIAFLTCACLVLAFGLRAPLANTTPLFESLPDTTGKSIEDPVTGIEDLQAIRYDRAYMSNLPGIGRINDVFTLESSAVMPKRQSRLYFRGADPDLGDLHLRGGDLNQVQYLINGSPVQHPIFGGRNLFNFNLTSIDHIELYKGVSPARFGHAQSGVVNMHLRDAPSRSTSDSAQFEINYRQGSEQFGGASFDRNYLGFFVGGPFPDAEQLRLTFSGGFDLTDNPYHMGYPREASILGLKTDNRLENHTHFNATATYQIDSRQQLSLTYNGQWDQWGEQHWLWKNYPSHLPDHKRKSHHVNVEYEVRPADHTGITLDYSYLQTRHTTTANRSKPDDFWRNLGTDSMQTLLEHPSIDLTIGFVDSAGFLDRWYKDESFVHTFKGNISTSVLPRQKINIGYELQDMHIKLVNIMDGAYSMTRYGRDELYRTGYPTPQPIIPPGPYKFFGDERSYFDVNPNRFAVYIDDQINLWDLNLRLGLRYDRFDKGSRINDTGFKRIWHMATGIYPDGRVSGDTDAYEPFQFDRYEHVLSPRLTLTYPYNDSGFFFSYGHFHQMPELHYLYRSPHTGGLIGNPALEFIKTEQFEFGWSQKLFSGARFRLNAYHKDVDGLPAPIETSGQPVLAGIYFENASNSRIWGSEFGLDLRPTPYWHIKADYTLQWARGFVSSVTDSYTYREGAYPGRGSFVTGHLRSTFVKTEKPLTWSRRHQVVARTSLISPQQKSFRPFGIKLPTNWKLSAIWRFDSGVLYTPTEVLDPASQYEIYNTATTDYRMRTDLKFTKGFNIQGIYSQLFIEIFNLFDQYNVNPAYGFNNRTGEPYKVGDLQAHSDDKQLRPFQELLTLLDPRRFYPDFRMQVGLNIKF